MKTHADKPSRSTAQRFPETRSCREAISQSTDHGVVVAQRGPQTLLNNRPQSVKMKQWQDMADNRPEAIQMKQWQETAGKQTQANRTSQLQKIVDSHSAGRVVQKRDNNTGLPDKLKSGIEHLSGIDVSDVKVHYNSSRPAQFQAHAYAQGADIHLAPGQEQHLPHEAWHVVQQKQGRVKPTVQMKTAAINDDAVLEKEADVMGVRALQVSGMTGESGIDAEPTRQLQKKDRATGVVQRLTGYEVETNIPVYSSDNNITDKLTDKGRNEVTHPIKDFLAGGLVYDGNYGSDPEGRYYISADHNPLQRPHTNIIASLSAAGFLGEDWKHRAMANIEYITPARDELAKSGRVEHQADITAVKTHLEETVAIANQDGRVAVPAPAQGIYSGIPKSDLIAWVTANNADRSIIEPEIDEMIGMINNQVYVQETSGVLPEDIPALYTHAAAQLQPGLLNTIMAELMTTAVTIGGAVYDELEEPPEAFTTHENALKGYITLIASYVLADHVSQTNILTGNSTGKNLLPFLSKTPLHETMAALPAGLMPGNSLAHKGVWDSIREKVIEKCEPHDAFQLEERYRDRGLRTDFLHMDKWVFPGGVDASLEKIFAREEGNVAAAPGKPLTLDNPHEAVEAVTSQKGIPLEDRFFGRKYADAIDTTNMEARLNTRFGEATNLQLGHVPNDEDQRTNLAATLTVEPSAGEKLASLILRIGKNIQKIVEYNALLVEHLAFDEVDTTPWTEELAEAQLVENPQKTQRLTALAATVHTELERHWRRYSRHLLSITEDDTSITTIHGIAIVISKMDKTYNSTKARNLRWYKPATLLHEADRETAATSKEQIDVADTNYTEERDLLSAMTAETAHQTRADKLRLVKTNLRTFVERSETARQAFGAFDKVE